MPELAELPELVRQIRRAHLAYLKTVTLGGDEAGAQRHLEGLLARLAEYSEASLVNLHPPDPSTLRAEANRIRTDPDVLAAKRQSPARWVTAFKYATLLDEHALSLESLNRVGTQYGQRWPQENS